MTQNQRDTTILMINHDQISSIVDDFIYGSNVVSSDVSIRLGFLRNVYGVLSAQLVFVTVVSAIVTFTPISEFIKEK
jgi:hypothetical protein